MVFGPKTQPDIYSGWNYFDLLLSFFLLQPTYVNPLVAVRFSLVGEKEAKIQCRVVSEKISYENIHDPYEGKVVFYLKAVK